MTRVHFLFARHVSVSVFTGAGVISAVVFSNLSLIMLTLFVRVYSNCNFFNNFIKLMMRNVHLSFSALFIASIVRIYDSNLSGLEVSTCSR